MDQRGKSELISLVYNDLRVAAGRLMRRERRDHTLTPTAVVNEAVIRLVGDAVFERSPDHGTVCAAAMRVMREVLIDHARRRAAARRGGDCQRVSLDAIADQLNTRPRKTLGYRTPAEALNNLLVATAA